MERLSELERLNRLYSALRQINRAIIRRPARSALFDEVCAALVRAAGFRSACVRWHDPKSGELVPVARAGDGAMGPEGASAFPIRCKGARVATLTVHAAAETVLEDEEAALLAEVAADVSFALELAAEEEEQRRAVDAVKRLAAIVESTDDAIIGQTLDNVVTSWNRAATRIFGYTADEIVGRSVLALIPHDRAEEEAAILRRLAEGERVRLLETVRIRKDGTFFPVAITYSPIRDESTDAIVGVSKIVRDISEWKAAEAIAERERGFAESLIEAMPGIFYFYDEEGRFLRWNANFEKVSGYSGREIAKMHPLEFFRGPDKERVATRIGAVFERGESSVEADFVAKDGTATPHFFTGRRIPYDGATCLVGVGVDIAERKRAEAALAANEERYRRTLDSMLEAVQILDFDWTYLYLNDAAAIQNRRANAELLGRRMPDAWPGIEGSEVFALIRKSLEQRVPSHGEIEFMFPDGASGWFDVRARPVREGVFILSIDISERKRAERAIHELNEGLERKVEERTRDLAAARERAEAADKLKSAFLATMSHELRTPLNSIIGFTGIVLAELAGPLNDEQKKQLGMVKASARHLLDLINDVLDISKIEAGQLEVRRAPFDLREAAEQVIATVRPMAEKKGLGLHLRMPRRLPTLVSDRRRVEQILLNLVNNGIKFTERGEVSVTIDVVEEDDALRVVVRDTGIGMKKEDLAQLFQPFRQIDSGLERQHEGTGLGLAICRRLTDLLGGSIGVESALAEGSAFTVRFPLRPEMPA